MFSVVFSRTFVFSVRRSVFLFSSFVRSNNAKNANDLSPPSLTKKRDDGRNVLKKPENTRLCLTEPVQRRIIRITRSCSPSTLPRSTSKSWRGFVRRQFSRSGINRNFVSMNLVRINKLLLYARTHILTLSLSRLNTYLRCNCNNVTRYMYTS